MANEALPGWFRFEVVARLSKARRVQGSSQHYACCPAHDDKHASMGIKPGDKVGVVFNCQRGCDPADIRRGLLDLGVPEEFLGVYGSEEYEARQQRLSSGEDRRKLDAIKGMLTEKTTPAMLRVRVLAEIEGCEVPGQRKPFVDFAERAGVGLTQRYDAWKQYAAELKAGGKSSVVCGPVTPEPVSVDYVVLAAPVNSGQEPQVSGPCPISDSETLSGNRKDSLSETEIADSTSTALGNLRSSGLIT